MPGGYGQDLVVTVEESDGRKKTFSVPYSSVSQLLRPGISRYSVAAGQYQDPNLSHSPNIAQATYQRGLNNLMTAYGGAVTMDSYIAGMLGGAFNTAFGALALDLTYAQTKIPDYGSYSGSSWRFSYSKDIDATDTNLTLAAYRYSTENYFGVSDAAVYINSADARSGGKLQRVRNQLQVSINQPLGGDDRLWGSLYLSGSVRDYWDDQNGKDIQYQMGYSNSYKSISYNISLQRYYNPTRADSSDDQLYISLSIPLGGSGSRTDKPLFDYLSTSYSRNSGSRAQNLNASASGSRDLLNYNIGTSHASGAQQDNEENINGALSYSSRYADLSTSLSASNRSQRQASFSMSGGAVAHSGGITFTPDLDITRPNALIEARGAQGAEVGNGNGTRIDNSGYAITAGLSEYHFNNISISPIGMENNTELKNTDAMVVPRAGALVKVKFKTDDAQSVLFYAVRDGAQLYIPMGSSVLDEKGNDVGSSGQNSIVFARGGFVE